MQFEYLLRTVADATVDIDDIGNCALATNNDLGEEYYLIIKTDFGWTELIQYGPAVPEIDYLPYSINYSYARYEVNESKTAKIIDKFLSDPRKMITQVRLVTISELRPYIKDILGEVLNR